MSACRSSSISRGISGYWLQHRWRPRRRAVVRHRPRPSSQLRCDKWSTARLRRGRRQSPRLNVNVCLDKLPGERPTQEQRKVNTGMQERASRLAHLAFRTGVKRTLALLKWFPVEQRADLVDLLLSKPAVIDTPHGKVRFLNHSGVGYWRARTIMTKEPDSMRWIDAMVPGSVFWDIGANVGVLTLYAAMRGNLELWAFEPAAVNYYNLVANCELNGLEKRVRCLQLGFSDRSEIADLHVSQLMSGRSFTFRESTKVKPRKKVYPSLQAVQLCTIDDFIARYGLRCPNKNRCTRPNPRHLCRCRAHARTTRA
jgi:FkbM family methyltransferase